MHYSAEKLVRYAVAYVFIVSALLAFISPDMEAYFISLGLPIHLMYLVAVTELICGGLILLNKHVSTAAIPLMIIIVASIILTKLPTLNTGILQFAYNARLDIVMLILLYILYKAKKHH